MVDNSGVSLEKMSKKTLSIPDLKELIVMVNNNTNPSDIASSFDISISSVYNWMNKLGKITFDPEKVGELIGRRGPKHKNVEDRINKLADVISSDCSLTQGGMAKKLLEHNINISQSTVSTTLRAMKISRKRLVLISDKKNDPQTLSSRHTFAVKYRRYSDEDLLYLDETGFNLHSKRSYGYSPINCPARIIVRGNKGKNVTLLALISTRGILGFKIFEGACNSNILEEFFVECIENNIFRPNNIILMDNVNFHKSINIKTLLRENNIYYDYIPIYSPELNPIEEVFGMLKNSYYNLPSPKNFQEIKNNVECVINEWRNNETSFENFYNHMRFYLGKAFMRENF